jgi:hypothetical protein
MEIINTSNNPLNFEERLRPLFDAMCAGQTIKSVTCFTGEINKNNREKDFTLRDFKGVYYWVAWVQSYDGSCKSDFVNTSLGPLSPDNQSSFYMDWVISFELY